MNLPSTGRGKITTGAFVLSVCILGIWAVMNGCTRNIGVAPTNPVSGGGGGVPVPTNTFTPTPTPPPGGPTNTPTVTPTVTATPPPVGGLITDFSKGVTLSPSVYPGASGSVTLNGTWSGTNGDGTGSTTITVVSPGPCGTGSGGYFQTGPVTSYANITANFIEPPTATSYVDFSAYNALVFNAYSATGGIMYVGLGDSDTVSAGGSCTMCNDLHTSAFCVPTSCQAVTIYFANLAQQGWGDIQAAFKPNKVYNIQFSFPTNVTMGVSISNITLANLTPPSAMGPNLISDFRSGTKGINPGMTNYLPGSRGFESSTSEGAFASPLFDCATALDGDAFAAHVNSTWTVSQAYDSATLTVNLFTGTEGYPNPTCNQTGPTYFDATPFINGIKFDLKVVTMSGSGMSFSFSVPTANSIPVCYDGQLLSTDDCGAGACGADQAWDVFTMSPAKPAAWTTISVPWNKLATGGWGVSKAPCSDTVINDGCNNKQIMQLQWSASSGNYPPATGSYTADYWVDNVRFY